MAFVQFSKVSLAFGDRDIIREASVNLSAGTKAALTGANGSGKSTLMKVMSGIIPPDSGDAAIQKDARVVYLPQSGIVHHGATLEEEAESAFSYGAKLQQSLEEIAHKLELAAGDEKKTSGLLVQYTETQTALENSQWSRRRMYMEQVLTGLGFSRSDFSRRTDEFSGGWQMRIALSKALMQNPDILLLDEPTNYLDLEARTWLESWLRDFSGGFLIVSHDRYFLDTTVNEVYELFGGDLRRYVGNYSAYEKIRETEIASLLKQYDEQQEEIRKSEEIIRRFRYKATKAAMVQERIKRLEKMDRITIPEHLKKIHFSFPPAPHTGRIVQALENVGKSYGSRQIIHDLSITVEAGDRLVVVGRNGAGKTTLLRILAGKDSDFTGTVTNGSGVTVGYFSQDSAELMTGGMSIIESLEAEASLDQIPKLRDMLGAFLFRGDDIHKSINVLSGGEKSRLSLLKLLLKPINLLILDEPTNHLDMHSKDVLLSALQNFGGTVIFVSHDRSFIEKLATRVLELRSAETVFETTGVHSSAGVSRIFSGDYAYYLERIEREQNGSSADQRSVVAKMIPGSRSAVSATNATPIKEKPVAVLSYEEEKKRRAEIRKKEKEEARLLELIDRAETEKAALEQELSLPAVYSDGVKSKKVQQQILAKEQEIEKLTAEWEAAAE